MFVVEEVYCINDGNAQISLNINTHVSKSEANITPRGGIHLLFLSLLKLLISKINSCTRAKILATEIDFIKVGHMA
jgi:hypothetical protein